MYISTTKTRELARRPYMELKQKKPVKPQRSAFLKTPKQKNISDQIPYYASPMEIKSLTQTRADLIARLEGSSIGDGVSFRRPTNAADANYLIEQINTITKKIIDVTPKPIKGKDKDKALKVCKEFERAYHKDALPTADLYKRGNGVKLLQEEAQFRDSKNVYIHLQRRLDPDNPRAGDLEKLRRAK